MIHPKISIVTPSYNQGKYLEQTIQSVIDQHYPNLEYIIIDGGSSDDSLEIIKRYENHLKFWVSERDFGQSNAINKGLQYCSGEIFNWINSDDYLAPNVLFKVAEAFESKGADVVAGIVCEFDEEGLQREVKNANLQINEYLKKNINLVYHQPAVWLRLEAMKGIGSFREDLHYCFDQEYMMRYLLRHHKVQYLNDVLAYFRVHPQSKSVSHADQFAWEFRRMYRDFWYSHRKTDLGKTARRKYLDYEWPLLNNSINDPNRSRILNFLLAARSIFHDPAYRLNKKSLGWLKHILLGNKDQLK